MYFSRIRIQPDLIRSSQLHRVIAGNLYGVHRLLWDLFAEKKRTFLFREEIAREQLGTLDNVRGEPVYYVVSQTRPVEPEHSLFSVESKVYKPQFKTGQTLSFECRANPVITKKGKKHDVVMDAQLTFFRELTRKFNLQGELPANHKKRDYQTLLLNKGGKALNQCLSELLADDSRYAELLQQNSGVTKKLEWAKKAKIDKALEGWWKRQGERCGFNLAFDNNGLCKFQNSAYLWRALPAKDKTPMRNERVGFSSVDLTGELQITDVEKFNIALFNGIGRSKAFGCGLLLVKRN